MPMLYIFANSICVGRVITFVRFYIWCVALCTEYETLTRQAGAYVRALAFIFFSQLHCYTFFSLFHLLYAPVRHKFNRWIIFSFYVFSYFCSFVVVVVIAVVTVHGLHTPYSNRGRQATSTHSLIPFCHFFPSLLSFQICRASGDAATVMDRTRSIWAWRCTSC